MECNLACDYCYIRKRVARMDLATAELALDFIASRALPTEDVDIGLFGGEPLLVLPLVLDIVRMARAHRLAEGRALRFQLVSNGTIADRESIRALSSAGVEFGISCDGMPAVQNAHRRYRDGRSSAADVEKAISIAVDEFPYVMVNAVYSPDTIRWLPDTVSYLYGLGVRNIFLNVDYAAPWRLEDLATMCVSYADIADLYVGYYVAGAPARISLIDAKIIVLLNGGYAPHERCSMGRREFAFGPEGNIYPCERLAGDCLSNENLIGCLGEDKIVTPTCHAAEDGAPTPCGECTTRDYCMHWCGCSNYFATGSYNRPGPFLCASEKESLRLAAETFERLSSKIGPGFINGLGYGRERALARNNN
jgi:uncharacterized protein